MIAAGWSVAREARLPQLSDRWVITCRLLSALLASCALALLIASIAAQAEHSFILAVRGVKLAVLAAVCVMLLRRRARDPVAALLCLAFLTWSVTSSFDFASASALPAVLDRVRFLLFVLALLLFPDGSFHARWAGGVATISIAVCALGLLEASGLVATRLFLPPAVACVIAAIGSLGARLNSAESDSVRQQLKWVGLGLTAGVGLILGARTGAALAASQAASRPMPLLWEGLFQAGIVLIALGFLVSLLRYRLFDAETAISRSAALAVLTGAIVGIFAGTEATIEWIGQQYFGMGIGNIAATAAAAVAAVVLSPLHERTSAWAEHHFQRDLVKLKEELPELLDHLALTAPPAQLARAGLEQINSTLHATRSAITLRGKLLAAAGHTTGKLNPGDYPLQLRLGCPCCDANAVLLLGSRPDGSLYGADDLQALNSVLPALRHALEASLLIEEVREQLRTIRSDLDRQQPH